MLSVPVAVVVEPSGLRDAIRTRAIADPGRAAVQRVEEARERGPVRRRAADAPGVLVVHEVQTRARGDFLLPDDPNVFRRYNVRRDEVQADALAKQTAYLAQQRDTTRPVPLPRVGGRN